MTYSPEASALPAGTTPVTVLATDAYGNSASCTFRATRSTLVFDGFRPPISGINGDCDHPVRDINRGSVKPIKFRVYCNGTELVGGIVPTFTVTGCSNGYFAQGVAKYVAGEWQLLWDATVPKNVVYKIDVTLPDGTHRIVFVRVK